MVDTSYSPSLTFRISRIPETKGKLEMLEKIIFLVKMSVSGGIKSGGEM